MPAATRPSSFALAGVAIADGAARAATIARMEKKRRIVNLS
jgi:hypothetical protein